MTTTTEGNSGSAETSTSEYSVVDPGYEAPVDVGEVTIESLRAENTKKKPSETSDDASEADSGETEETAETSSGEADSDSFEISDELLDRAVAVGYELDDIRDFKDAKAFEKELKRVERIQSRLQQRKSETADSDAAPETKPDEEEPPEPDWEKMVEDGHDKEMVDLQKLNWQRGSEARALVKQLQQAELARAAAAQSDRFDDAINGLGSEYESLFGKGRRGELMKSSPEAAENRQKVFTMMSILRDGYAKTGQAVPSDSDLIQAAVQATFSKQAQEIARKGLKNQIKNAGSQALSRPRSGGMKELHGPEKALAMEREFWKSFS